MNLSDFLKKFYEEISDEIRISYYVINFCKEKALNITNLKLIKLLYFINIEYMLENNGVPIFQEEFLAWRHGPVLQSVYDYFCGGIVLPSEEKMQVIFNSISPEKKQIIDKVLKDKAYIDAWSLMEETHVLNGPWSNVYNKYKNEDGICKAVIKNVDIYNFYKEYYEKF